MPKPASESWVPWMIAGDRRYFWPSSSQASSGLAGSSTWSPASAQVKAANAAWLAWSGLRVHLSMSSTEDLLVGTGTFAGWSVGSAVGWSVAPPLPPPLFLSFLPPWSAMSSPLDSARFADGDFDAVSFGLSDLLFLSPLPPVEALGEGLGVCAGWSGALIATSRNRSWAVCLTESTMFFSLRPGISTMIVSLPCVDTSDSATP